MAEEAVATKKLINYSTDEPGIAVIEMDHPKANTYSYEMMGVGAGIDADGDTVVDEVTAGEMSAMSVFMSSLKRPGQTSVQGSAAIGMALFNTLGCADCHVPFIDASTRILPLRFPQVATAQGFCSFSGPKT